MRKTLAIAETDSENRFVLGTPYLLRDEPGEDFARLVMSVQNSSTEAVCGVSAEFEYVRADGSQVLRSESSVFGSIGKTIRVPGRTLDFISAVQEEQFLVSGSRLWAFLSFDSTADANAVKGQRQSEPMPPWVLEAREANPGEREHWLLHQRNERQMLAPRRD